MWTTEQDDWVLMPYPEDATRYFVLQISTKGFMAFSNRAVQAEVVKRMLKAGNRVIYELPEGWHDD